MEEALFNAWSVKDRSPLVNHCLFFVCLFLMLVSFLFCFLLFVLFYLFVVVFCFVLLFFLLALFCVSDQKYF